MSLSPTHTVRAVPLRSAYASALAECSVIASASIEFLSRCRVVYDPSAGLEALH